MYTVRQQKSISAFQSFVGSTEFTRKDIVRFTKETGENKKLGVIRPWFLITPENRVSQGVYQFPSDVEATVSPVCETHQITPAALVEKAAEVAVPVTNLMMSTDIERMVPELFKGYVSWGHHKDVKNIIKSKIFYPMFITGLSGNGKTLMVQQTCAELKREMVRVNITIETDEDDLIGGFRLVDGETKFNLGPVAMAMEKGAVLLLDEIDLASNKIMCLQPVLEGNGIYIKKINRYIKPAPGFTVIATANTKGKGSDDGRFIGTNILNEAFLERFPVTMEQPYPATSTERKMVLGSMEKYGKVDEEFATRLVTWAEVIRKSFYDGAVDELISTRRLDHIVKAFAIFGDRMKAIELCVNRFDEDTKASFLDLYSKVDEDVVVPSESEEVSEEKSVDESNIPF
jgi:MoxR-like ATPase